MGHATVGLCATDIRLDHVTVTDRTGRVLLDDITLDMLAGQTLGIVGASGAGKTTLIRLLSADRLPHLRTTGSVAVGGIELRTLTDRQRQHYRRTQLGVVHQHPAGSLNPTQRVVAAVLELLPRRDRTHDTATQLLREVDLPTDREFLHRRTHQLSGGQRQRLAIARTLANQPRVILLDEPTAELDHATRDLVLELLAERTTNTTTLLVAHDPHVITTLSDDTVGLDHGRLAPHPPTKVDSPRHPHADGSTSKRPGPTALGVIGLTTSHADVRGIRRTIIDDLTLTVARGETVAITGPSGVGKTTLARAITGLHEPDVGAITLHGQPLPATINRRNRAHRRAVQLIPQDPTTTLPPTARILDIVARPATRLRGLDTAAARLLAANLLEAVGLPVHIHRRHPHELSGGERQRTAIARALAAEPDILICDEITSALDSDTTDRLIELLADLREQQQLTLLVITHDPDVAIRLADRTLTMSPASDVTAARLHLGPRRHR